MSHTTAAGMRRPSAPPSWPFGRLTEQQQRQRAALEARMRAGRLARYPEGIV